MDVNAPFATFVIPN